MASNNLSHYDKSSIPNAEGLRFGIVVSEWNSEITEGLYKGAHQTLLDNGVAPDDILRMNVPGSFELVFGCAKAAKTTPDAIIALGSVIRGETAHFDYVCQAVTHGIKDLNVLGSIPVIFGVLTDDTREQAEARSGGSLGNKGAEAAADGCQPRVTRKGVSLSSSTNSSNEELSGATTSDLSASGEPLKPLEARAASKSEASLELHHGRPAMAVGRKKD